MPQVRDAKTGRYTSGGGSSVGGAAGTNPRIQKANAVGAGAPAGGESPHGKLVKTYGDGTKGYEKPDVMSDAEAKEQGWYRMMDSVIVNSAADSLGVSKYDIDYDKETGLVTKWNNTDPSTNGFTKAQKEFYQTEIHGTKVTSVRPDGTVKSYFRDMTYSFKQVGGKF